MALSPQTVAGLVDRQEAAKAIAGCFRASAMTAPGRGLALTVGDDSQSHHADNPPILKTDRAASRIQG